MKPRRFAIPLAAAFVLLPGAAAQAYVGPGAGLSLLGALWGLLLVVLISVGLIVAWPVRRMLLRRRATSGADATAAGAKTTPALGEREDDGINAPAR